MNDNVHLIVVFVGRHIALPMPRREASRIIAQWVDWRSHRSNTVTMSGDDCAFAFEAVVAIYVHVYEEDKPSPAERIADVMERQAHEGDEWRGGP